MTALLCTIFFLSGAAALIFETLWFRQTGLTFGNGVWATSLVLAGFMAGLALGNAVIARIGHRVREPVRLYAQLELAIAVTGVALVFLLPALTPALTPILRPLLDQPWLANPLRLFFAFLLMLIPASAMGATLPLLVRALQARSGSFGSALGRLYGWNTLGAVAGALAGEAFLLEWVGVHGAALFAAGLNILVAVLGISLSRSFVSEAPAPTKSGPLLQVSPAAWRRFAATFLAGGTLLALEVVWFRFLQLFINASSLVFSLMLAVVLSGIALGSLAAGAALRRWPSSWRGASLCAALAGAFVSVLYRVFAEVELPTRYVVEWWQVLSYGALLMLPVSFCSGALFTALGAGLEREVQPATRAAGLLTFFNTIGSGLGSLLGGFILLPLLGMERSFFVLGATYGVVALLAVPWGDREAARRGTLAALSAATVIVALVSFPFGLMREHYLRVPIDRVRHNSEIAAFREGRSETILYLQTRFLGEPLSQQLVTNGFSMSANSAIIRRYMKAYVWLPVALRPEPHKALLISYGVGTTAKGLTDTRSLEQIDVVDLSREVLELSDVVFRDPRSHPLRDPRVRIFIDDGRYHLQTSQERYDLITGEPPPPKNAGIVNLYTREYFELVHERLAEGGIHTY